MQPFCGQSVYPQVKWTCWHMFSSHRFIFHTFPWRPQVQMSNLSSWQDKRKTNQPWVKWRELPDLKTTEYTVQYSTVQYGTVPSVFCWPVTPVFTFCPCVSVPTEVPHPMMTSSKVQGPHHLAHGKLTSMWTCDLQKRDKSYENTALVPEIWKLFWGNTCCILLIF